MRGSAHAARESCRAPAWAVDHRTGRPFGGGRAKRPADSVWDHSNTTEALLRRHEGFLPAHFDRVFGLGDCTVAVASGVGPHPPSFAGRAVVAGAGSGGAYACRSAGLLTLPEIMERACSRLTGK